MSPSEKTVLGRFVSACALVLLAAVLLWLAVWLLQQIWGCLLLAVIVAVLVAVVVGVVRARRDHWFR